MKNTKFNNKKINIYFWLTCLVALTFPSVSVAQVADACSGDNMATQLICNFGSLSNLAVNIGYVLAGLLYAIAGFAIYSSQNRRRENGVGTILGALIAATVFLAFSNIVTIYQDFFMASEDIYALHQYNESLNRVTSSDGSTTFGYMSSDSMKALLSFVKFVGIVAMLKSVYLIYDAGRGNDPHKNIYFQIIVYAVGGAMAFRIEYTSCLIADFFSMPSLCLM